LENGPVGVEVGAGRANMINVYQRAGPPKGHSGDKDLP
jgi:hypothetical protein